MKKRTIICLAVLLILSMTLSACASGGSASPSPGGGSSPGGSTPADAPELKAGAVLGVGGLGDQSFASPVIATVLALVVSALIMLAVGYNPLAAYR